MRPRNPSPMKSGVAVSVLAPGTPDRDVEDKRATVVTYVACAVAAWVAVVVTCLAEYGGGMPAVAEAARSVRIPQAATTQLATLVAFAVVIWTDTVSMAACRDAHKRVLFGLMIMINGLPFVTYSLIVTGLAPSYLDWFGHTVYPLRYAQWCFTTPALILLVSQLAHEPASAVVVAMVVDVVMVISGWLATWVPAWQLAFGVSTAAFTFVMWRQWQLLGLAMRRALHHSDERSLWWVRVYTMVIWTLFPAAWLLAASGVVPADGAQLMIAVCDIGAKLIHSSILRVESFMSVNRFNTATELVAEEVITDAVATDERVSQMRRMVAAAAAQSKGRTLTTSALRTLSTELQGPLSSIVTFNSMLLGAAIDPVEKTRVYSAMQSALKLEDVVLNAILYSDFERNGYPVAVETEFEVEAEVEAVVSKLAGVAADAGVYVAVSVDAMVPVRLFGAQQHLDTILSNLIHNAIKYSQPGSCVSVKCRMATDRLPKPRNRELLGVRMATPERRFVDITVKDEGCGIDVREQRRVFAAFERGSNEPAAAAVAPPSLDATGSGNVSPANVTVSPTSADPEPAGRPSSTVPAGAEALVQGVGLGLTIAQVLAAANGGALSLTSAPGAGTTVACRIPFGVVVNCPDARSLRSTLLRNKLVTMALLNPSASVCAIHMHDVFTSLGVHVDMPRIKHASDVVGLMRRLSTRVSRGPATPSAAPFMVCDWHALGGSLATVQAQLLATDVPVLLLATPFEKSLLHCSGQQSDVSRRAGAQRGRGASGAGVSARRAMQRTGSIHPHLNVLKRKALVVLTAPFSQRRVFKALTSLHRKALRAKSVRVDGAVDVHVNTSSEDSGTSGDEESTDVSWLRVLVVDDSRVNRLVLARMLKKLGVRQVDTAADGAEAVDMASCGRYDVIFMDILMPVMGGLEATAKLRSDPPKDAPRPIIVSVTASDSAAQGRAATVAGVDDQMLKPVHLDTMRRMLERLIISGTVTRAHTFSPVLRMPRPKRGSIGKLRGTSPAAARMRVHNGQLAPEFTAEAAATAATTAAAGTPSSHATAAVRPPPAVTLGATMEYVFFSSSDDDAIVEADSDDFNFSPRASPSLAAVGQVGGELRHRAK